MTLSEAQALQDRTRRAKKACQRADKEVAAAAKAVSKTKARWDVATKKQMLAKAKYDGLQRQLAQYGINETQKGFRIKNGHIQPTV